MTETGALTSIQFYATTYTATIVYERKFSDVMDHVTTLLKDDFFDVMTPLLKLSRVLASLS